MILMMSVLFLGIVIFLLWSLFKLQKAELKIYFWPGLLVRLASGISLGLIYTYYYSVGDTFGFFKDAQVLVKLADSDWGEYFHFLWMGDSTFKVASELINSQVRSLFFVKVLSVIMFVSFSNYWIASLYLSLISFLGSWYLVTKVNEFFKEGTYSALISFLAIPSFLFWSSGIIKESLAAGALMFLAGFYIATLVRAKLKWWEWLIALMAVLFLWNLKYYWAALFIPAGITTVIVVKLILASSLKLNRSLELLIWIGVFCSITLVTSTIHPNFYLSRLLTVVVENHDVYAHLSSEGPFVYFDDLQPKWSSILENSPWALISGLYRPFIFEATTFFQIIISVENALLLILTFYNIKHITSAWNSTYRLLIFSAIVYIILLAIFLTLSTPNFGTLSRYRVGFLPFLFFLLLYYPCLNLFDRFRKLM